MADHPIQTKRKLIKRWLHAGIYRNARGIVKNIWFAYQKRKDGIIKIVYADNRFGTRHGRYGVGLWKADLITWNECYLREWSKYLDKRGTWLLGNAIHGRKQRRKALISAYKNGRFYDPHPDGINSRSIGPLINVIHAPDKTSMRGFDIWDGGDGNNDENPAKPSGGEADLFYPGTKIPQSISEIKGDLWKEVDTDAIKAARLFFRGDLAVKKGFPDFYKKNIDIVESLFLELGWRVDRGAVERAYEEICGSRKGCILQTRAWQAAPPIRVDMFKGDELQELIKEMAEEAGTYSPNDYDEIDLEDEEEEVEDGDEDGDKDQDEEIWPKNKSLPTSKAGREPKCRSDGLDSLSLPNSDVHDDSLLPRHLLKQKKARTAYLESSDDDDENLFLKRKKTTTGAKDDSDFENVSEIRRDIEESEHWAKIRAGRLSSILNNNEDDSQSEVSASPSSRRINRRQPVLPFKYRPRYSMSKGKGKAVQGVPKHYTDPDIMIDEATSTPRSTASSKSQNFGPKRAILERLRVSVRSSAEPDSVLPSIERNSPVDEDQNIPRQTILNDPDAEILEKKSSLVGDFSAIQTSARHVLKSIEECTPGEPPFEIPESSVDGDGTNNTQDLLMITLTENLENNLSDKSALASPAVAQGTQIPVIRESRIEVIDLTMDVSIDLAMESSNSSSRTPKIPGPIIDLTGDDNDSDDDLMIDEERSAPKGIKNEPKVEIIE